MGKIPKADNVKLSDQELNLGTNLIEEMSDEFDPEKYRDEYRIRVLAMLEEKSTEAGLERNCLLQPSYIRQGLLSWKEAKRRHINRVA